MCPPDPWKAQKQKTLQRQVREVTLAGGTEGSEKGEPEARPLLAFSAQEELVVALDSALGALSGMFAAAVRPHSTGARLRLDAEYETLITSVEAFRDAVPKA